MNVQIHPSFADLTTPLLSPDILGSFEALAEGRCSLSELNDSVLEACRSDPNATEGVLLLLESYANSEEFERFDLGPLKRALERGRDEIDDASAQGFTERDDQSADVPVLAPMDEPRMLRGRYILEAEIGRGGVGTVYRALDLNRGGLPLEHRHVALKVLGENAARRPDAVDTLRREYHQAQSLSHPGIVNVFDFDHDGDTYFVTMELLDGESLGELTRRLLPNKLPLEAATRILRELGDAIVYAHDRGILHLDLKPDNVMVDADGHVRVLDFGIAQTQIAERIPQMRSAPPAATPAYASCERLVQERPDVRDDIFSFSCIAYELLVGRHPFDRSSVLKARKDGRKARRSRALSRRQWAALESGLAWAREDRPANMRELLQRLALHSSAPAGTPTRRVTWHRAAAVALVMFGSAALLNWARIQDRAREGADERVVLARDVAAPVDAPRSGDNRVARASAPRAAAYQAPDRRHDEGPASSVDTKPVSEGGADDVTRRTPDALAPTRLSPQAELETATPSTPDPTFEIESAGAVARPASLPAAAAPRATAAPVDVLGFSRHSFSVSESDPVVHVNVRRLGGATGDIAFQWYTVDDSARAGQDYVYGFGEVLMAPGQTTATFDVPIVADTIREDPELLQVIIGSSRGAHVGAAGRAPVIIVDDD
jgi:serine/threonine protein kinase